VPKIPGNFRKKNDENLKKFLIFKKFAKLDLLAWTFGPCPLFLFLSLAWVLSFHEV